MDLKIQKQDNKNKPPKLVTLACAMLAFALPYYIVKLSLTKTKPQPVKQISTLALPREKTINNAVKPIEMKSHIVEKTIKRITTKPGDNLATIFKRLHINASTLNSLIESSPHKVTLSSIKPGLLLEFQFDKNKELDKFIIPLTSTQKLTFSKNKDTFVETVNTVKLQSHVHYTTATIKGSLYQTSKRLKIPYKLLLQMVDIFKWKVDFSRDIRDGDQFTLLYTTYYNNDKVVGTGDILAVKLTNRGKQYQALRYKTNHSTAYFDPKGHNLQKAFDRYPLHFTHISSPFSLARNHPVLGFVRPHKGIDLAARLGTPIKATSNGKIVKIGRHGGYGNLIEIKHLNGYSTRYAHMVRFRKGLSRGSYVKRGQVIGYVGQTGLADGPHCHYEFLFNGRQKNPASITLPHAPSIPKKLLANFKTHAHTMLAQLQLYEQAQLASQTA